MKYATWKKTGYCRPRAWCCDIQIENKIFITFPTVGKRFICFIRKALIN